MTTTRVIYDQVKNAIDFLTTAELAIYANAVSMSATRVSWQPQDRSVPFLIASDHPSIEQYMTWLRAGHYSALLFDGSLLQITYDVKRGEIAGHRLAYFPCPYDLDATLVEAGEPIADVLDLYRDSDASLRSPVRFDYDPESTRSGHPAAHFTINTPDCRIACVAPLHVLRFVDFVFRHFYSELWRAHEPFFRAAASRHLGPATLGVDEVRTVHLMWDVHASAGEVPPGG